MFQAIGLLAGGLSALSYVPYVRSIFNHGAKPERASWLIWSIGATLAVFSQHAEGASASLWFTILDVAGSYLVFVLSLWYGLGGFLRRDVITLLLLGIGLVIWRITHNPIFALLMTMGIDASGAWLTIVKTLEHPESESYPAWLLLWTGSLLATVSVGKFNPAVLLFPVYMFFSTGAIVASIFVGRRKHGLPASITSGGPTGAPVAIVASASPVIANATTPTISSPTSATAIVGLPFSFTITTTGHPAPGLSRIGKLPDGLSFRDQHDGTALVVGTPAGWPVTAEILVVASSPTGNNTQTLTLEIRYPPKADPSAPASSPQPVAAPPAKL
jgi:hypothetical protein